MRKVSLFTILLVFVIGISLSFGFGLGKLKGTLKKAEKELKLGDLNAKFKKFEGTDSDPYKTGALKYNVYGDKDFDGFLTSSHKVSGTVTFANTLMDNLYKGVDAAKDQKELDGVKADAEMLQTVLTDTTTEGAKLAGSGTAMVKKAPNKFKSNPMDLKVVPELVKDLKGATDAVKKAADGAKVLSDKIAPLMQKITEKAKTFAG